MILIIPSYLKANNCLKSINSLINNKKTVTKINQSLFDRISKVHYPDIPSVYDLHLANDAPTNTIFPRKHLSAGITDPLIERARELKVFDDFKPLSDVNPIELSKRQREKVIFDANTKASEATKIFNSSKETSELYEKVFLRHYIENVFNFSDDLITIKNNYKPKWKISTGVKKIDDTFNYIESYWHKLIRKTDNKSNSSILVLPYEFVVPNEARFDELYYWDSFFGIEGLLTTGRLDLAQKLVDNFLHLVRQYGLVPNGNRDYYLSRSQPPFLSSMVVNVFKKSRMSDTAPAHLQKWLSERAYPLLKHDFFDFWMNPKTRFDEATGLHHHWDDMNHARPERHSADKELADNLHDSMGLGITYRDTRAVAESGLDFTDALGKEASSTANVLLNSMIYKYIKDLEFIALELGLDLEAKTFSKLAENKKQAINKYLWNEELGVYLNYNLSNKAQISVLNSETFVPLYVGASDKEKAASIVKNMHLLESRGGLMASVNIDSHHQWDGVNGWAPYHMMAIQGLLDYGYQKDAKRLANKWVNAISDIYKKDGVIYERIDVANIRKPDDTGDKYPTQTGFLWTNSSFVWILKNVLNVEFESL